MRFLRMFPFSRGLALSLVLIASAGVGVAGCSDSSVMHMRVGQCIQLPEGTTATTIDTTGCTREHDAEVFALSSAEDGDFPGSDALNTQAESACVQAFEDYVGTDYLSSSLDATWMIPTRDSWARGDRSIVCLARPLDHSKLSSPVRDSGL